MSARLPYYASLCLREEDRVGRIRDEVWAQFLPAAGYEKVDPHITIHPGFSADSATAAEVAGVLAYTVGREFEVTGLSFWPGPNRPVVVKLDLEGDAMDVYRQTIEARVREGGGTIDRDPVPPHITLFKSGDADEEPDGLVSDYVCPEALEETEGEYGGWAVEVAGYRVTRRG